MIVCKNCGNNYEGNFCPSCGQRYIDKRFTLKDSIAWLFASVFNLERGFLPTTIQLITKPGVTIRNYLSGITIPYAHPFRFVFIWSTVSAILTVYLGIFDESTAAITQTTSEDLNYSAQQQEFMARYNEFIKNYLAFVTMGMIPITSFFTYLLFKKKGFNYAENLVMQAYATGSSVVIGLPVIILYYFLDDPNLFIMIIMLLSLVVVTRVYKLFFKVNVFQAFIKYILSIILTYLTFIILLTMIIVGAVFIYKALGLGLPFGIEAPAPQ